MNKFCSFCGKELKEGEVCDCQESKNNSVKPSSNKGGNMGNDLLDIIKKVFVKPIEVFKKYLVDDKLVVGVVLVVVAALARGLYTVLSLYHVYSKSSYFKDSVDYFKNFFETFGSYLWKYAALVLIIYAVVKLIFKTEISWKKIVTVVGVALVPIICYVLVSYILLFFDGDFVTYLTSYLSTFTNALYMYLIYEGICSLVDVDKNKLLISMGVIFVGVSIASDIFAKLFL